MREVRYTDAVKELTERMQDGGVFLTVGGEKPNTMTIGWGAPGYMWNKDVFVALVRLSRHTFLSMGLDKPFTVSVPAAGALRKELAFAGTRSGRDVDKFSGHGLTALPGQKVDVPVVAECGLHIECVTRLIEEMKPDNMSGSIEGSYRDGDMHVMFYGEVVACYRT